MIQLRFDLCNFVINRGSFRLKSLQSKFEQSLFIGHVCLPLKFGRESLARRVKVIGLLSTNLFMKSGWTHKLLTLKVIAFAWAIRLISWRSFDVIREILAALASWSRLWRSDWINIAVQLCWIVLMAVIGGALIARISRQSPRAMVLVYAAYFASTHLVLLVAALLRGAPFQLFIYGILAITVTVVGVLIGGGHRLWQRLHWTHGGQLILRRPFNVVDHKTIH
jgi:hypothetical protein